TGAQFASRDARAEEFALVGVIALAADGVGPETVAAIDNDVAFLDAGGDELLGNRVHSAAGFDENDDDARFLEDGDEIFEFFAADQAAGGIFAGDEFFHHVGRAVIDGDVEKIHRPRKSPRRP